MSDIFRNLARHAIGAPADIAALPNAEEIHNVSPRRSLDWPDDKSWRGLESRKRRPDATPQNTESRKAGGAKVGQPTPPREDDDDGSTSSEDPEHADAARRPDPSVLPGCDGDGASQAGPKRLMTPSRLAANRATSEAQGPSRQFQVENARDDAPEQLALPGRGLRPRPPPTFNVQSQEDGSATDAIPPLAELQFTTGRPEAPDALRRDLPLTGQSPHTTPPTGAPEDSGRNAVASEPPVAQRKSDVSEYVAATAPQAQNSGGMRTPPACSVAGPARGGPDAQAAGPGAAKSEAPTDYTPDAAYAEGSAGRLDAVAPASRSSAGRIDPPAPTDPMPGPQGQDGAPVMDAEAAPPRADVRSDKPIPSFARSGAPHNASPRQPNAPVEHDAARTALAPITAEGCPVASETSVRAKEADSANGASVDTPHDARSRRRGGEPVRRSNSGQAAEEAGGGEITARKPNKSVAVQDPRSTSETKPAPLLPTSAARISEAAEPSRFSSESATSATRQTQPQTAYMSAPEAEGPQPYGDPAQAEKRRDRTTGPKKAATSVIRPTPPSAAGIAATETSATTSPIASTGAHNEDTSEDIAARDGEAKADGRPVWAPAEREYSALLLDPDRTAAETATRPPFSISEPADRRQPSDENVQAGDVFDRTTDPEDAGSTHQAIKVAPEMEARTSTTAPTMAETESAPDDIHARQDVAGEMASTPSQQEMADAEKMISPLSSQDLWESPLPRMQSARTDVAVDPRKGPNEVGSSDSQGAPLHANEVERETDDIPFPTMLAQGRAEQVPEGIAARSRSASVALGDTTLPNKAAAPETALSDKSRSRDEAISEVARQTALMGRSGHSSRALSTTPLSIGETFREARSEGRSDDTAGSVARGRPIGEGASKRGAAKNEGLSSPAQQEYHAKKKVTDTSQPTAPVVSAEAGAGAEGAQVPKAAEKAAPTPRSPSRRRKGQGDEATDPQIANTHPDDRTAVATAFSKPTPELRAVGEGPPATAPAAPPRAPDVAISRRGGENADADEDAARKTPTIRLGVFHVSKPLVPPAKRRTRPKAGRSLVEILANRRMRR